MFGQTGHLFALCVQFLDMLLVTLGFFMVYSFGGTALPPLPDIHDSLWLLPWFLLFFHLSLRSFEMYHFNRLRFLFAPTTNVFSATLVAFLLAAGLLYFYRTPISRTFITAYFLFCGTLLFFSRLLLFTVFQYFPVAPTRKKKILIIGTNFRAEQFAELVIRNPGWGYEIIGFLDKDPQRVGNSIEGLPVMGTLDQIETILRNNQVDQVVVSVPRSWLGELESTVFLCEEIGITVHLIADFFQLMISKTNFEDFYGMPILSFLPPPERPFERMIKRGIDISASGLGLLLLSPFLAAIALLIKITMPGPVLFCHERVGRNKRRFQMYKFRTMVVDAEAKKRELAAVNEMDGPVFKIEDDPRVTWFGKFLRRFSIDELPQLWNVFAGDMSLVGPRPPTPDEVEKYDRRYLRRLSMRPGLTCIWQVSGRNLIGFADWMKMDLYYIDNWSLWLDFQILLQTIPVVLTGHGAS